VSSDREYTIDLLAQAYRLLIAYGVQYSTDQERVLLMDEISLELRRYDESAADLASQQREAGRG
jgi:hypothetical protein